MQNEASARSTLIAFVIVAILIIGSGALLLSSRPEPVQITINPPIPTPTSEPSSTPSPIMVYVTGAVNTPEITVELPHNSRVMDAISAAGGLSTDADEVAINMAGILRDGDQVHVPAMSENITDEPDILATKSGGNIIYINTATQAELETLPGVGPALAERIIAYREENGAFASLEDLDEVSGVGEAMLENIKDLVSFD